jgi:hypothetical protein
MSRDEHERMMREIEEESKVRLQEMQARKQAMTPIPATTKAAESDTAHSAIGGGLRGFKPSAQPDSDLNP